MTNVSLCPCFRTCKISRYPVTYRQKVQVPLWLFAAFWIAFSQAAAQGQTSPVSVPETAKLSRLVDLSSEVTGTQYVYAPADLDATVTLRVSGSLSPQELQDLLTQVLASRGFAAVQGAGSPMVSIVKLDQAAANASLTGAGPGAGFITTVIRAAHQPAKSLAETIRPMLSKPAGAATVLGDSSLIAISDFSHRLEEIKALIDRIDVPDSVRMVEVPLRHIAAAQAVTLATRH
jgi:type II secretory pathway component GspD/PulD (secretin)